MSRFKTMAYSLWGHIYIPEDLKQNREKKLLHISDTPGPIFPGLRSLINNLKPNFIIHTGDLVDNLKLEISPQLIVEYERYVEKLINILESSTAEHSIITLGNHDNRDIIEKYSRKSLIIDDHYSINILGSHFKASHYSRNIINNPAEYNLFGHDLSIKTGIVNDKVYLNGIRNINIITLESMKIYYLPYPWGTEDLRLCRGKFGL